MWEESEYMQHNAMRSSNKNKKKKKTNLMNFDNVVIKH